MFQFSALKDIYKAKLDDTTQYMTTQQQNVISTC